MKLWNFRPSALSNSNYPIATIDSLHHWYDLDNIRANEVTIPPHPQKQQQHNNDKSIIRIVQWNVHYFINHHHPSFKETLNGVLETLANVDPDIIVLNEVRVYPNENVHHIKRRLEKMGYKTSNVSNVPYSTAIFTRLQVHDSVEVMLDEERSSVAFRVSVPSATAIRRINNNENEDDSKKVWIYGTHLTACELPGLRAKEMKVLFHHIQKQQEKQQHQIHRQQDGIVIVGDFNQQRQCDYLPLEWRQICESKARRDSPTNDGVAHQLKEAGFQCGWDVFQRCNWEQTQPPPSTHWTGTIVDYAYVCNLVVHGAYVSPSGLSDHRLVVHDLELLQHVEQTG